MEAPNATTDERFDAAGNVVVDQTCRRCGYNLRGLHRDGRCPECGSPVDLSLHGDLLRLADPNWVEKLARGSKFVLHGLSTALLAAIAGGCVELVASGMRTSETTDASMLEDVLVAVCTVVAILGLLVFYFGVWLMTSPDPTRAGEDLYATSRRLVRTTLLISIGNEAVQFGLSSFTLPSGVDVFLGVLEAVARLAFAVGVLAHLRYLGKLALRVPDERLSKRSRFLFGAFLITPAAFLLIAIFASTATANHPLFVCAVVLLLVAMFMFVLMGLRLQYRVGRACREQAAKARQTWGRTLTDQQG
jgi:hypothetical protein